MSSSTAATPAIAPITRFQRSISAAVALIFTAPLVAEFLLGNLPIKMLGALVALAPFRAANAQQGRFAGRCTPR